MLKPLPRDGGFTDDVVVLAAPQPAPPPALTLRSCADSNAEGHIRLALCRWLVLMKAGFGDHIALEYAVTEVVAKVTGRVYPATVAGPLGVTAVLTDQGCVQIRIISDRPWNSRTQVSGNSGAISQQVLASSPVITNDGATVTVNHRLNRRMDSPIEPCAPQATHLPQRVSFEIGIQGGHVIVIGDVDTAAAATIAAFLSAHSYTKSRPMCIDLTAVTFLSAAAVTVFKTAREHALRQHNDCVLIAFAGSIARLILAAAGVPTIDDPGTDPTQTATPAHHQ